MSPRDYTASSSVGSFRFGSTPLYNYAQHPFESRMRMDGFTYQNQNAYNYPYPYDPYQNSAGYFSQPLQSMPLYNVSGPNNQFFQRDMQMPTVSWMCSCPACLISIRQFLDSLSSTYGLCANISGNGPAFDELMANALKTGQVVPNMDGTYELGRFPFPNVGAQFRGPATNHDAQWKARNAEGGSLLSHESNGVNGKLEDNEGGAIEISAETTGKAEDPTADKAGAAAVDNDKIEDNLTSENSAESDAGKESQDLLGAASTESESSSDLKDETLDKFPGTPDASMGSRYGFDGRRKWRRFGDQERNGYTPRNKFDGGMVRYGSENMNTNGFPNNFNGPAPPDEATSLPFYDLFWTFYWMSLMGYGNLNLFNNIANNYNGWYFNTNGASSSPASTSSSSKDLSTRSTPSSSEDSN